MRLAVLLFAACAIQPTETTPAPLSGVDGAKDAADRACNVVLRGLTRNDMSGIGNFETNGDSWVFSGTVEISAEAAAEGLVPQVMWSRRGGAWQTTATTAVTDGSATPGFAKFAVRIDHDAPGPAVTGDMQLVPYLELSAGGRLFDHNRNPGSLDNYVVGGPDYAVWGAPATCAAPTSGERATLTFAADFTQAQDGVLTAGGQLAVAYDWHRLAQCQQSQAGHPQWDITAHVKFDSGELLAASVRDAPALVTVPTDGARHVALWFEATNVSGCHAWDSAFGANYNFDIAVPPQWIGLAQNEIVRDGDPCGGADAANGFSFDTWARQRAGITNLCFQVYQPGMTDRDNPDLWKQLDARVHWRLVAGSASTAWTTDAVNLQGRTGNNARYAWPWRAVDPFRDFHCPEIAPTKTTDGVQIQVEYYIDVNGGELRPEPGAAFGGIFSDYPTNPWRDANCM